MSVDTQQQGFLQKNWKLLVGAGCILFILFVIVLVGGYFLLFSGGGLLSGGEVIVYSIEEYAYDYYVQDLYSIKPNGNDNFEIASNKDGLLFRTVGADYLAVIEQGGDYAENVELGLVSLKDGSNTFLGDVYIGLFTIVSDDGTRIAFFEYDDRDQVVTLVVTDTQGEQIISIEDYLPIEFISNNELLVFYYDPDDDDIAGIGVLDLKSGDYNEIGNPNSDDLTLFPTVSSNNKYIFYGDQEDLLRIDVDGRNTTYLYEFDNVNDYYDYPTLTFFDETKEAILLEDGDLYLFNIEDGSTERIDRDVIGFSTGLAALFGYGYYDNDYSIGTGKYVFGAPFLVSPNGDYMAYVVDGGDSLDLKVYSFKDGTTVKVAKSGYWFDYAFTPNSKTMVILEYDENDEIIGDLYTIDVDGSNRVQLDRNVTSFALSSNGKLVYYATADNLDDEPDSDIYTIKLNGNNKTNVVTKVDGIIWIVDRN